MQSQTCGSGFAAGAESTTQPLILFRKSSPCSISLSRTAPYLKQILQACFYKFQQDEKLTLKPYRMSIYPNLCTHVSHPVLLNVWKMRCLSLPCSTSSFIQFTKFPVRISTCFSALSTASSVKRSFIGTMNVTACIPLDVYHSAYFFKCLCSAPSHPKRTTVVEEDVPCPHEADLSRLLRGRCQVWRREIDDNSGGETLLDLNTSSRRNAWTRDEIEDELCTGWRALTDERTACECTLDGIARAYAKRLLVVLWASDRFIMFLYAFIISGTGDGCWAYWEWFDVITRFKSKSHRTGLRSLAL